MSAKLIYSLSDNEIQKQKQKLKKQMGCMNGLLQFFDPHHFINNRTILSSTSIHATISADENKKQGKTVNNASKRSKEKYRNVIKERQVNPIESSRHSFSCSDSTTISSPDYESTTKPEKSPFTDTISYERQYSDSRASKTQSSPCRPSSPAKISRHRKKHDKETFSNSPSPIKSAQREVATYDAKHLESPRLSNTSRPDSPRLAALNDSFRSISSNHSAPAVTPRNKDIARFSYDGRETRDCNISTLKLRDLPRLSLDSKQRNMKASVQDLNEPASCRTPSNIVAKLMGLEVLPDHKSPDRSQTEHDDCSITRNSNLFSRSSRNIDASKVEDDLHTPRSSCKESRTPRLNKAKAGQTDSTHDEAHTEPIHHPLTVYGAMEKRLADLDFKRSGKDLRALKQILESMHREKRTLEVQQEHCTSHNISSYQISGKPGSKQANPPTSKGFRSSKGDNSTTETKMNKTPKELRNEATQSIHDIPLARLQTIRIQRVDGNKDSAQKKSAKNNKETHHILNKYSRERTPRPIRTSKAPESTTRPNPTSSFRITDTGRTHINVVTPAIKPSSKVKNRKQAISQNQKLSRNSPPLQEPADDQYSEFSSDSARTSQQHTEVKCDKKPEGTQVDIAFEELAINVTEQPSPVSVLDASFYDDESPSPVKKKPTAFTDFESNALYTEAEIKNAEPTSPDSIKPGFSCLTDYQEQKDIKEPAPNNRDLNLDKSYVSEILSASGLLHNCDHVEDRFVHPSHEVINPKLFYALEQTKGSRFGSDKGSYNEDQKTRTNDRCRRRLLFDAVNEIISQKLAQTKSRLLTTGPQLLQQIHKEIDQLQPMNLPHSLDDEDDFLTTIIDKDLTYRSSNWINFSIEIPGLVLDIERLIFKDLIVELVHDEAAKAQVLKHSK